MTGGSDDYVRAVPTRLISVSGADTTKPVAFMNGYEARRMGSDPVHQIFKTLM
jgi:hypothetical protein